MADRIKFESYVKTEEWWCGSYVCGDQRLLKIKMCNISPPGHTDVWRVSVWGNDDMGVEMDYFSYELAYARFLYLLSLENIKQEDLLSMGFRMA